MDLILPNAVCAFAAPLRQVNINKMQRRTLKLARWLLQEAVASRPTHPRAHTHGAYQKKKWMG